MLSPLTVVKRSFSLCSMAITSAGNEEEVMPILASQPNMAEYGVQFIPEW